MKKGRGTGLKGRRKLAAVLLGLLILSACKAGEDTLSRQKEIVDETARIVLLMDQDSRDYDLVLQEIGRYLDEPDPEILAAVQQKVQESTAEFQTRQDQAESYEMTEDFADILVENHIDPEEYQMNADSRISSLGRFITRLQTMDTYLEMVSILPGTVEDDLRFMYEYNLEEPRIPVLCGELLVCFLGRGRSGVRQGADRGSAGVFRAGGIDLGDQSGRGGTEDGGIFESAGGADFRIDRLYRRSAGRII